MPGVKRVALVLIGVLLSVRAFAAEPAASDAEAADPRLQAKISFSSPAAPLPGLLAFLSDASGVEFSVYSSRESWWIKELTVCMSAKDLPLLRIRAGLSDLLNLRWARYGKEPRWSYALWQDRRTREKDEAELAALYAAIRDELVAAIQRSAGLAAKDLKGDKKLNLRVHGRTGQACDVCGTTIAEVSFADSSLQYCPGCQTGGKPLADRRLSRLLK